MVNKAKRRAQGYRAGNPVPVEQIKQTIGVAKF